MLDVQPLEEWTAGVRKEPVHLCDIRPAIAYRARPLGNEPGGKNFFAPNPPYGAVIYCYYLEGNSTEALAIAIADPSGKTVATLKGDALPDCTEVIWDLRPDGAQGGVCSQAGRVCCSLAGG